MRGGHQRLPAIVLQTRYWRAMGTRWPFGWFLDEPREYIEVPREAFLAHGYAWVADTAPLTVGEPADLTFDLLPTSYLFRAGHRIRVALACADRDHFALIPPTPPTITVYRQAGRASHVVLPIASGM